MVSDILRGILVGGLLNRAFRRASYNGTGALRLSRRVPASAAVVLICLATGGCSFSYQLDSLFEKSKSQSETTGSLKAADAYASATPQESDLVYTRAAVSEVLTRGGKDASAPWENPHTGARGTITPLATPYTQNGATCRDFLASYVRAGNEGWMQGEACRVREGRWEVRSMRPWKRS
jgi:hypothetical protein